MIWHREIRDDTSKVLDFVDYFNNELKEAQREVKQNGLLVNVLDKLPGYHEQRYSQLQEIEAVLEIMDTKVEEIKTEKYKKFLEHYNRVLSSTDVKRYVEGDIDVVQIMQLRTEVSFIRNQFFGIIKSFEMKHYALGNITKIRCAGIEDATL